jgi:hypothetical protein
LFAIQSKKYIHIFFWNAKVNLLFFML